MNKCPLKGAIFQNWGQGGNMRRWEREKSTTLGHANLCYRFIFHFKIHLSQLLTLKQCMMCKQVFCNATACTIYIYISSKRQTNVYPSRNAQIKIQITCNSTRYSRTVDSCKHKELLGNSCHNHFICLHYLFKESRSWLVSMLCSPSYSRWRNIWREFVTPNQKSWTFCAAESHCQTVTPSPSQT